ncbi:cellular tumor antigen p53-like [Schistocerca nitens]|uniref:cellular tumor antigen p53-like n=1 Tax=Schistocerca nitens TaxID=7011 RepID=UPI00211763A5|nr:cellular tumor antigen p53-like [Schistocerca nitens]XP_049813344.1 cellular tumor antigen p53-like [Schistocerca nitens]XP_049813345.1 cellular tumor antigen p53-like [Schistocerca nitens]
MMTEQSLGPHELIKFFSDNMDPLDGDPLLDPSIWENSDFDASTLQMQDTQNSGFVNNIQTGTLPSVSRLVGDYNFAALISPDTGPDCLFSTDLNKIFVNINKNIPVQFRLIPYSSGLYIRALAVYVSSSDQQEPVIRCITHVAEDEKDGKDVNLAAHVLRCASANGADYFKNASSGRFSVRIPVDAPQSGMESFIVCYKFTCLNSCQQRNGRRGMGIIFTLENDVGDVLGRQFMNMRVCSCPKRDKEKEEKKMKEGKKIKEEKVHATKRPFKTTESNEPPKKVVKPEPGEAAIVKIPVKVCHIKELAKFASDLIYRDVGKQQRQLSDQDKSLLAIYNSIIETPEEELLRRFH